MSGGGAPQGALRDIAGLLGAGQFAAAAAACNALLHDHPDQSRAWYFLSEARFGNRQYADSIAAIEHAIARQPGEIPFHLQHGKCLLHDGQRAAALAAAERAVALKPSHPQVLDGLGTLFSRLSLIERAHEYFARAAAAVPDNASFLFNLATAQRMLGQIDAALESCERVIALEPGNCRARYLRADLHRWTSRENHIGEMEALLAAGVRCWQDEMLLCFALGKECEDVGLYEASFSCTKRACGLQRARLDYDVQRDIARIDALIATQTRDWLHRCASGTDSVEPIFIVGLPRSGTTLVEHMLAAHGKVTAAGELDEFPRLAARYACAGGPQPDWTQLGRDYLAATRPWTGRTARFTDKLPRNYLLCGWIHAALPGARLILLERGPADACYAAFKTMLSENYPFTYDLDELGRYYAAWRRLMDHWRELLGDSLLTVRYEDLVSEPEAATRRILEFCNLDWTDAALELDRGSGAITTASAVQARQPLHRESIGKWQRYRVQLQPLLMRLRQAGIRPA